MIWYRVHKKYQDIYTTNMKLLKYQEFLTENSKYNEYLETLPFWREFVQKFNMSRNRSRREKDLDVYRTRKGIDLFHDDEPTVSFLDEWNLERIHYDWGPKYARPEEYGGSKENSIKFDGLKDPEIGDILVSFRGYAWLFKPDERFNYKYSSSAGWTHDKGANRWDDLEYMDGFIKAYTFKLEPGEVPMIFRKKLARNIRPNIFSKETGYKQRQQKIKQEDNKPIGYSF